MPWQHQEAVVETVTVQGRQLVSTGTMIDLPCSECRGDHRFHVFKGIQMDMVLGKEFAPKGGLKAGDEVALVSQGGPGRSGSRRSEVYTVGWFRDGTKGRLENCGGAASGSYVSHVCPLMLILWRHKAERSSLSFVFDML